MLLHQRMVVAEVGPQLPGHPPPPLHHYQLLLLLTIQKEPHTGGGSVTGPPTAWVVVQKKWGQGRVSANQGPQAK